MSDEWADLELFTMKGWRFETRSHAQNRTWGKELCKDKKKYLHEYYLNVLKPKRALKKCGEFYR